jgi:hypothetical protein
MIFAGTLRCKLASLRSEQPTQFPCENLRFLPWRTLATGEFPGIWPFPRRGIYYHDGDRIELRIANFRLTIRRNSAPLIDLESPRREHLFRTLDSVANFWFLTCRVFGPERASFGKQRRASGLLEALISRLTLYSLRERRARMRIPI